VRLPWVDGVAERLPLITGIRWVSELIGIAGGEDCFRELSVHHSAKQRILADASEVIPRAPDVIIGSWCGKHFQPGQVTSRPGWDALPAVRNERVFEVKSAILLAPGPAAIREGLPAIARCLDSLG
jgi:iron complex transport system substrate-binding protein